jgi:tetratricopeptide (TPR) repeat protein
MAGLAIQVVMTFLAWVAGALLWLFTSGTNLAFAQAPTTSARDEEARALFEAGKVAYEDGRYVDALGYFERSFELSHRAGLQYNLGLAYDRLRRDREALEAYEAYLSTELDPKSALEVENRVRALRESLAAEDAAKAEQSKLTPETPVVPLQRADSSSAERTRKRRMWIGIAAGVVAVGAGVAISVLAAGSGDDARPKPNSGVTIQALTWH